MHGSLVVNKLLALWFPLLFYSQLPFPICFRDLQQRFLLGFLCKGEWTVWDLRPFLWEPLWSSFASSSLVNNTDKRQLCFPWEKGSKGYVPAARFFILILLQWLLICWPCGLLPTNWKSLSSLGSLNNWCTHVKVTDGGHRLKTEFLTILVNFRKSLFSPWGAPIF